MPTAMSAGSAEREKSTTTIELRYSNEGPGGFTLVPFFLFFFFSWSMGVGLPWGGLFYGEKEEPAGF